MKYLHTMIRVTDLNRSLDFYRNGLGFEVISQTEYPEEKFTLVFLESPSKDQSQPDGPKLELTYNWNTHHYERGNAYGHVAYRVDSIAEVQERLKHHGYDLSWGPGAAPNGKTKIAFVDDPDGYEIELVE